MKNYSENLSQYQLDARKTAQYPSAEYPFLCLVEESSELLEKMFKFSAGECSEDDVAKEAGDVCWELAMCCHELDQPMEALNDYCTLTFADMTGMELITSSGNIMSVIAKAMRKLDCTSEDVIHHIRHGAGSQRHEEMLNNLGVIWGWILILGSKDAGGNFGTINDILNGNIDKLQGRVERGTICGEGDNR